MPYAIRHCRSPIRAVLIGFLIIVLAAGSQPKERPTSSSGEPTPVGDQPVRTANLEYFGVWVKAARESFSRVKDYQCTLRKRERVNGNLQDEQIATMKVRQKPFSVHLKFTSPRSAAGREGSYVQGRLGGKMRAKAGGALGLVGYVTLAPTDPKAMMGSRHAITEAGIGNLIDRLYAAATNGPAGRPAPQVLVSSYTAYNRECIRIDIIDPVADGIQNHPRTVVYFDRETNLPVRYEAYDQRGEMVETFAYTDLRFNIGLSESSFP